MGERILKYSDAVEGNEQNKSFLLKLLWGNPRTGGILVSMKVEC